MSSVPHTGHRENSISLVPLPRPTTHTVSDMSGSPSRTTRDVRASASNSWHSPRASRPTSSTSDAMSVAPGATSKSVDCTSRDPANNVVCHGRYSTTDPGSCSTTVHCDPNPAFIRWTFVAACVVTVADAPDATRKRCPIRSFSAMPPPVMHRYTHAWSGSVGST